MLENEEYKIDEAFKMSMSVDIAAVSMSKFPYVYVCMYVCMYVCVFMSSQFHNQEVLPEAEVNEQFPNEVNIYRKPRSIPRSGGE